MSQKPKQFTTTFFNWKELSTSFLQGITITIATLSIYQYCILNNYNEALTRTMVFTVLIVSNIFLTLINRSFYYSILTTLKYKNPMVPLIILITITLLGLILYIKPLTLFFEFEVLEFNQLAIAIVTGFISVAWYEIVKLYKRKTLNIA